VALTAQQSVGVVAFAAPLAPDLPVDFVVVYLN